MKIEWVRCHNYDDAKHFRNSVYLHEWNGEPFYWGKIEKSFFGGHMRTRDGFRASGRYNSGYKHWIEGCLQNGASLYFGMVHPGVLFTVDEVENYLIDTYPSKMNVRCDMLKRPVILSHTGDIPMSIQKVAPQHLSI